MATQKKGRTPRTAKVYPDEVKIEQALTALNEKIGEKEPTDAQKQEKTKLRAELGALKFARLAKARAVKIISGVRNLGKLGTAQYTRTDEQVKNLFGQLRQELAAAEAMLSAKKSGGGKVQIEVKL